MKEKKKGGGATEQEFTEFMLLIFVSIVLFKNSRHDAYDATILKQQYCLHFISAIWNNSHFLSIFRDAEIFR